MEFLNHLLPNFSLLKGGSTEALGVVFWLIMAALFTYSVISLIVSGRSFKARMRALNSLIAGQSRENLAVNRRETLQKALGLKVKLIGALWHEFDDSLVSSSDHKKLFNTLDAEHFFNARTLAPGLSGSRFFGSLPGLLVGLGVLATFVGLTIGLQNLKLESSAGVDQLRAGISVMIQGAAVAFMASVWGVGFSLLLNLIEKITERWALGRIQDLQHRIDALYPLIPAEQSLVHIADYSRESKVALQELHERIGERLQESLVGMNEAMQTALTDALNNIMAPAIQTLVSTAGQQSTQVLEQLVSNFTQGLTSAGREQGNLMQQAAADVNAAVGGMTERLNQLFHTLSDQQGRQQEAARQQSGEFQAQMERLSTSSDQRQQQLETRFGELMSGLTGQLDTQLSSAQRRDEERQAMFERTLAEAGASQSAMLEKFASASREQLQAMAEAGNERHGNLEKVFSRLMMTLNSQLDSQMGAAETREQERAQRHEQQQAAALAQQQQLIGSLGQASQQQIGAIAEAAAAQQRALEESVGKLLGSFNEQMAGHGQQAEQREQSRQQRFNEQLENMAAQQQVLLEGIATAVQTTQQQSRQMAEQHQQLMGRLQQASDAAAASSRHMDSSANQLGLLSTNVRQAAELLGQRLESVTQRIESAGEQNAQLASQLHSQASALAQLQGALLDGAQRFEQAASEARNGFGEMRSHQQEFLAGVRSEFTALGEALRSQVQGVEQQAEQWLRTYSSEVRDQVHERMDQWNKETMSFANQMHAAVQAISNVVDELEAR
ncbi:MULTISPECIES: anti-phage ZorAB system protein ZorA [Pseudomonas]|uniref:anti-phage ZorAB system protein ZorA n=1 Tax=Pseudomonas TaxID=286 RepID=UPI00174CCDA4|nr:MULTISPECIES: anti-phage ZorAB system protein ZorA [Pseudomonas]MBJ7560083.1 anti-phage defense ZorAB system ZorA [Pseudomonas sp. P20]MBJ7566723.1 anti-phage defense ZorAB system ZorA [Pseudomonas sp. P22]MBM0727257.1 anti-phage defense ZorAB system ZorA [Pseudomonas aeruginosa]MBM2511203.1 anti-phage defense ZorAB system ZorA [Pseudomonas aeruginosa]MBM2527496.1 anti-phage defense ZorAB system ZorA [Pseudomonas aeruginosa]